MNSKSIQEKLIHLSQKSRKKPDSIHPELDTNSQTGQTVRRESLIYLFCTMYSMYMNHVHTVQCTWSDITFFVKLQVLAGRDGEMLFKNMGV